MEAKQVIPPYRPKIENDRDLEHFDPSFTNEPVILTPDDPKMIEDIDQSEFDGFEYVSKLIEKSFFCYVAFTWQVFFVKSLINKLINKNSQQVNPLLMSLEDCV